MRTIIRLTDKQIAKYKAIYLQTHGVKLTKDQARIEGTALIQLTKIQAEQEPTNGYQGD